MLLEKVIVPNGLYFLGQNDWLFQEFDAPEMFVIARDQYWQCQFQFRKWPVDLPKRKQRLPKSLGNEEY